MLNLKLIAVCTNKIIVFAIILTTQLSFASKVNFSLTPDIAYKSRSEKIELFSLGLWSENPQTALALGVENGSTGDCAGVTFALVAIYSDNYRGGQIALVNYSKGHLQGAQLGFVNYTKKLTGLQFGFFNYAETIENGVQIGLLNYVPETKEWFAKFPNEVAPLLPFVNWRFQ